MDTANEWNVETFQSLNVLPNENGTHWLFQWRKTLKMVLKLIFPDFVSQFSVPALQLLSMLSLSWEMENWVYWKQKSHRQLDVCHIGIACFGFHLFWFCPLRCLANYLRLARQRPPFFRLLKTTIPPSGYGWTQVSNRVVAFDFWTFHIPLYWWHSSWYSSVTPVKISVAENRLSSDDVL